MLRWLIVILVLANLAALGLASGTLGSLPASGLREPDHLNHQIHPEWLKTRPITAAEASDQPVVGKAAPEPAVTTSPLAN
ncbi:MAG TPA: hypothetical protein VL598_05375 [Trinickia sp.]|jgi:hypothetical protein|uniref:hypothetical protein n=1 Tax=Trinickia sp. TaxID=2571163 RepID=UPI002C94C0AF|nr:hypothetical protein [Trinickia sp.]HTI17074.1 hypothetical protein [Trinickia sp.]